MLRASILAVLLMAGAVHADGFADAPKVVFKDGASSSGWIDFKPYKASGIFFPARVSGRDVMVFLYGGSTNIDRSFAESVGLLPKPGASGDAPSFAGVAVEVGDLALSNMRAAAIDAPPQFAKITGQPVPLQLGEEAFNRLAVDIDYAHHRLAFRDPGRLTKPARAVEVPLLELDGERTVPLSINGAPPVQFELELGNVSGPLLVIPSYAEAHKLLEGRRTSQRLSGKFIEPVVTLDHIRFAAVDFPNAPVALVPDAALPPASITGGVGLPLLSHFRLIIDYPHDRLFAISNAGAAKASFAKDRLGLVVTKQGDELDVTFVSPGSPAESAGFAKGDKIAALDGKPAADYPDLAVITLRFADSGTRFSFTMKDGAVRRVRATDFF
jgi:PDZ domain